MLFHDDVTFTLKQMTQEASIKEMCPMSGGGYDATTKITFKSDGTVGQRINPHDCRMLIGDVHNLTTTKGENMIFPEIFTNLFQVLFAQGANFPFRFNYQPILCYNDSKGFLQYVYETLVVPFTDLEKENQHLRKELELKDQQLKTTQEELKIKHDKYLSELLKVSSLKFACEAKDEELEEKDQEIEDLKEKLDDYLLEIEEKDQEIEDLKEKAQDMEKKNQELEHLNHRLICETSIIDRNTTSYFSPEM